MPTIKTINEADGSTTRHVILDDGTTHDFDVDTQADVPEHEYQGDGTPPLEAVDALEAWLQQYHDSAPPEALPDVDNGDDEEGETATDDGAEAAGDDAPES